MATDYTQLEPWKGFGENPFGSPNNTAISVHDRGFGDPTTKYVAKTNPTTTWTDVE